MTRSDRLSLDVLRVEPSTSRAHTLSLSLPSVSPPGLSLSLPDRARSPWTTWPQSLFVFWVMPHPASWIQADNISGKMPATDRWPPRTRSRAFRSDAIGTERRPDPELVRRGSRDLSKPRVRWREPRREPQVCEGGRGAQDDNGLWRDLRTCCDRILRHVQVAGRQFGRGRVPQTPQIVLPAHALHVCYGVPSPMRRRLRRDTESTIRVKRRYRPSWRRSKSVEPSSGSFSAA